MKEKELRDKMSGLYGGVPADTHAAFEHALTHHREETTQPVRVRKMRVALLLVALMALLATGAYAVYCYRYSVTDYRGSSSQAFLDHVIALDETYENDLFNMTVNDLVFDGETFAVTLNILRHSEDIVYYLHTTVTAVCDGKEYRLDPEGSRGPDFIAGGLWPSFGRYYTDYLQAEQEGFGFEGVLWDWDMNPPPAGKPIDWTITFKVFRPLWEIVADNDISISYEERDRRTLEAWRNKQILVFCGDVNGYIMTVNNKLNLYEHFPSVEEEMTVAGAFELADIITVCFTTSFDDDVVKEEMAGQRYKIGEYTAVIDELTASFQRVHAQMHLDFGREMTREELEAVELPPFISVTFTGDEGSQCTERISSFSLRGDPDSGEAQYTLWFSLFPDVGNITSMTLQGFERDPDTGEYMDWEDFQCIIDIP
ncbi:MAG: hypothetical protein J1E43_02020 [Christensenellaceae bacterium]|nr:hypothetical protein [Christensenellaceae bacterium]